MSSSSRGVRQQWSRPQKRIRSSSASAGENEVEELTHTLRGALVINSSKLEFNLDVAEERVRLAQALWDTHPNLLSSYTDENETLASVLQVLTRNTYTPRSSNFIARSDLHVESLMTQMARARSQKRMPLLTARLTCAAYRAQLPRLYWQMLSSLCPGVLASHKWIDEFLEFCNSNRPPCPYETLPQVGAVMFDNYTRKVLYSSKATIESHGYLLNMTNWGTMSVPRILAQPGFDADRLWKKPFQSVSMSEFTSKFLFQHPELELSKRDRFKKYLKATSAGTLFARPTVDPPYVAHMQYASPPMWGVLQSSYADVEAELNVMRNANLDKRILFVGGDGLSILRINHLLQNRSELYLDSAPLIIPVQGEAPHGVFHVLHGGWRLYRRFIRAAADATLGLDLGRAVVDEPEVKNFNSQLFALWWMTRACSEYVLHLMRTHGAIELDLFREFIIACERNVDLAWVIHFLYDYAYLVLDFKQSVRANDSKHLDVLWREFFSIAYTSTANKVHYATMAIMRIFWSDALQPDLADLYHGLRAIPMSKRVYVGWDTIIEWLNAAITSGVNQLVSEERIADFISKYSVMQANYSALCDALTTHQKHDAKMRAMDDNVAAMKGWLMANVGEDWETATAANENSRLGIGRGKLPWHEIHTSMNQSGKSSVSAYVAQAVRGLTSSFFSFAP